MTLTPEDAVALAWEDLQNLHLLITAKPELINDEGFLAEMRETFDCFYRVYGQWVEA